MDEKGFEALLGVIYDGAVAPGSWPRMLAALSRPFGAHNVGHVVSNPDRSNVRGVVFGLDPGVHATFLRRWFRTNPVAQRAVQEDSPVVRSSSVLPTDQLLRTTMYQEYFAPHDLMFGLRLSLRRDRGGSSTLSIMRSGRAGDYGDADTRLAQRLLPHLQRADFMRVALREADLCTRAAWASLDMLPQPVLVLGDDRRVQRANLEAARLLAETDGIGSVAGQLRVRSADAGALERLLARAVPRNGRGGQAGSLRLERPSGLPLLLVAMPLSPEVLPGPVWDLPARPAALLCLHDTARGGQPSAALLQDLLGFTPAEAAVARALLAGETVTSIAARSSRSLATVRSHVAKLLSKTGAARQADLARLLASLPSWRPPS